MHGALFAVALRTLASLALAFGLMIFSAYGAV
jgi:hypothetical protein